MNRVLTPSLLVMLSAAIVSCGDSDTTSSYVVDGADGESASDSAASDGSADTSVTAPQDASFDACVSDGDGGCLPPSIRRPFLVGASMRSSSAARRKDWNREFTLPAAIAHTQTAERLARTWLQDALEEHASIAAFARFTMHLLSLGAPPDLVARSQRASLDEIHHARTCFALAAHYGKLSHGPAPLDLDEAMPRVSLLEIAALAAEEGCVGETLGAILARDQLVLAKDPAIIAVLTKIAADEERHAELAWRFVSWAVQQGGAPVLAEVTRRIERACASTLSMEIQSYDGIDLNAWHAHGRVTCTEARAIAHRAIRTVIEPCVLQLARTTVLNISREVRA